MSNSGSFEGPPDSYGPRDELLDKVLCGLRNSTGHFAAPGYHLVSDWDMASAGLFAETPEERQLLFASLKTSAQSLFPDDTEKAALRYGDLYVTSGKNEAGERLLAFIFKPQEPLLVLRHSFQDGGNRLHFAKQSPAITTAVAHAMVKNTTPSNLN